MIVLRYLLLLIAFCLCTVRGSEKPVRIAVIGGGVSGASVSYWLSQTLNTTDQPHTITLYERTKQLGGRVQSITINNITLESGGSIIHESNQYVHNFTTQFNLTRIEPETAGDGTTGIYDGTQFVFTTSTSLVWTALKLVWQYGFAYTTLYDCIEKVAKAFWTVYDIQNSNQAYNTVEELLIAMNLYNHTQINMTQFLHDHSLMDTSLIVQQLVVSAIRVNYGQNLSTNALAGAVGVIPLISPSCFKIDGGNHRLIDALVNGSNANVLLNTHVNTVNKLETGTYEVESMHDSDVQIHEYDYVIISTPLESADLQFKGAYNIDINKLPKRQYQTTHTTFINGQVNKQYFGSDKYITPSIVTTENITLEFTSLTQYSEPDTYNNSIYKVFSRHLLTDDIIERLFTSHVNKHTIRIPWKAYPKFSPPEQFVPFQLDSHLYYTNAWENSVSCIECEMVGSKNVALLILQSMGYALPGEQDKVLHINIEFDEL